MGLSICPVLGLFKVKEPVCCFCCSDGSEGWLGPWAFPLLQRNQPPRQRQQNSRLRAISAHADGSGSGPPRCSLRLLGRGNCQVVRRGSGHRGYHGHLATIHCVYHQALVNFWRHPEHYCWQYRFGTATCPSKFAVRVIVQNLCQVKVQLRYVNFRVFL